MNRQSIFLQPWTLFATLLLSGNLVCAQSTAPASADTPPPQKADAYQMNVPKVEEKKPVVIPDRKLSNEGRMAIIRGMTAEMGFARKPFPFGKIGLTLKDGRLVNPPEDKLQEMMMVYGPALKVGERARITEVRFKDKSIVFDINGGPQKKKKWYEHIQVSGMGGTVQPGQPTDETNIHGSFVELSFDKFVPDLTSEQLKQLLDPVINFNAKSATEAYLDTIPPKAKQAIADHKVLVGMDREMVTYAKGRPPQKYRDKDGDTDYEEWIYGAPPQEVEFIRFVGDEVVRVETMKVDGQKVVRNEREIVIKKEEPEVAQQQPGQPPQAGGSQPGEPQPPVTQTPPAQGPTLATQSTTTDDTSAPTGRPSLKRPGEEVGQQPNPQGKDQGLGPLPTRDPNPNDTGPANAPTPQ
jgi:hypothetical protein